MKLRGKPFLSQKILLLQPSIEAGPVVQRLPAGRVVGQQQKAKSELIEKAVGRC